MPRDVRTPAYVRDLAKRQRRQATFSERLLWGRLRDRALCSTHFKRQEPMGRYIAGFCAPEAKIIVEIDGASHLESVEYDQQRDAWFASLGYRVLRVSADQVENDMRGVLSRIAEAIREQAR